MWLDFTVYAPIKIVPIPIKYQQKLELINVTSKYKEIIKEYEEKPVDEDGLNLDDVLALRRMFNPQEKLFDNKVFNLKVVNQDEVWNFQRELFDKNKNVVGVDHENKIYYEKTEETQKISCDRSASGYGELMELLETYKKLPFNLRSYEFLNAFNHHEMLTEILTIFKEIYSLMEKDVQRLSKTKLNENEPEIINGLTLDISFAYHLEFLGKLISCIELALKGGVMCIW